ncbi:hypothetical protein GCM10007147_43680 [Nocardiopsis kunsanensis]|uniref:Secreted protein n=1 Tax=Nocardiopsis kunsanensis TaxID=141693 RepID=A0A918XKR6_9ACTN|nr:hypothetical protein GCM10007147_43680 [Nocardiopsis kunsanensis]
MYRGLATAFFTGVLVFTTGAAALAGTAGPFETEHNCTITRGEYNRYYDIDSYCFQYPAIGGHWWFHYS